jgi:hypothetical protein
MIKLQPQLLAIIDQGLPGLCQALQTAIRLEFSTIPPYSYALYSLKPGCNVEIGAIIRSILVEEMLHMALDCNILNAICGCPRINDPALLPHYPKQLPGSVESGLIVPLSPFSTDLIENVLMTIEQPEVALELPIEPADDYDDHEPFITIGIFYEHIKEKIDSLGDSIFRGDPHRQLGTGFPELQTVTVTNARTAIQAIDLIVEQGEGTKTSPMDPEKMPAHYYRLAEILAGRKLISDPGPVSEDPGFRFAGDSIAFDPDGVWPVITNPHQSSYALFPKVRELNQAFNRNYSRMLDNLQRVFTGEPDRLAVAINYMQCMADQAGVMMSMEIAPGQTAGPTFDYEPQ